MLVIVLAGVGAHRAPPVDSTNRWPVAAPAAEGMDVTLLRRADALARRNTFPNLLTVLVVRHGRIVFEHYYRGFRADNPLDLFSITKSVTSAAVGLALADGRIRSVDESLTRFFPDE